MNSQLVWRDERPDSPGIWMSRLVRDPRNSERTWLVTQHVLATEVPSWSSGFQYCKICDLPTIGEPVKYRDVTPADLVNGPVECQVSDSHKTWVARKVHGFIHGDHPYLTGVGCAWPYARMVDTPKPESPKPREWWVNAYVNSMGFLYANQAEALRMRNNNLPGKTICVREVLQP